MADEPKAEEGAEDAAKKKKKLIIIIAGAVGLVLILGLAGFFMFKGSGSHSEEAQAAEKTEGGEHGKEEKKAEEHGAKAKGKSGHGAPAADEEAKKEGHGEAAAEGHGAAASGHGEAVAEGHGAAASGHGKKEEAGHGEAKADAKKAEKKEEGINFGRTYNFAPFQLNLGNPLENRYLRLEISIEYKNGDAQLKEIEARKSQLRDAVVSVASRKTREFLLGPDGKDQLRLEILNRINQYMDSKIEAVYITDILIE